MKSSKIFFSLLLLLFIAIWLLSLALHSEINKPTSGRIIILIFSAIAGLLIMRYTLKNEDFKIFLQLYIGAWCICGLLYFPSLVFPVISIGGHIIHTVVFSVYFSRITFLYTPLPFIFYWIFLKGFGSAK